jgi:hypothetical protein
VKIFEPVSLLADTPMWIAATSTLPAKDLKGFRRNAVPPIVAARSNSSAAVARLPRGSATNLPGARLRFFFNGAQKAVVVELELPFLWTPALGIKCAIFRLNPL